MTPFQGPVLRPVDEADASIFLSGIVTAILRFVVFFKTDFFLDLTWYSVEMTVWTTAESGLDLIASYLPSLRPLLQHLDIGSLSSRLSKYRNKVFSGHRDTLPTANDGTTRDPSRLEAAGVSMEHLRSHERQNSSDYSYEHGDLVYSSHDEES